MKIRKYFLVNTIVLFQLYCLNTNAYIRNRANDLSDVIGISLDASLGGSASVGPLTIGIIATESFAQFRNGEICLKGNISERAYYGLLAPGSNQDCNDAQITAVVGINNGTLLHLATVSDEKLFDRNKEYSHNRHPPLFFYGRLKVRIGLGVGITVELNWIEATDFILGIFGIDLLNDDIWQVLPKSKDGELVKKIRESKR